MRCLIYLVSRWGTLGSETGRKRRLRRGSYGTF
jgi:hypothetical protein